MSRFRTLNLNALTRDVLASFTGNSNDMNQLVGFINNQFMDVSKIMDLADTNQQINELNKKFTASPMIGDLLASAEVKNSPIDWIKINNAFSGNTSGLVSVSTETQITIDPTNIDDYVRLYSDYNDKTVSSSITVKPVKVRQQAYRVIDIIDNTKLSADDMLTLGGLTNILGNTAIAMINRKASYVCLYGDYEENQDTAGKFDVVMDGFLLPIYNRKTGKLTPYVETKVVDDALIGKYINQHLLTKGNTVYVSKVDNKIVEELSGVTSYDLINKIQEAIETVQVNLNKKVKVGIYYGSTVDRLLKKWAVYNSIPSEGATNKASAIDSFFNEYGSSMVFEPLLSPEDLVIVVFTQFKVLTSSPAEISSIQSSRRSGKEQMDYEVFARGGSKSVISTHNLLKAVNQFRVVAKASEPVVVPPANGTKTTEPVEAPTETVTNTTK